MNMKRKLVFLPTVHSKEVVDDINLYFEKGYRIEEILNADYGQYLILVLEGEEKCYYKYDKKINLPTSKYSLIEEKHNNDLMQNWTVTNTKDIQYN